MIQQAIKLATSGYNNESIRKNLKLSFDKFKNNKELLFAINDARAKVQVGLLKQMKKEGSATSLKNLLERFEPGYDMSNIRTPDKALRELEKVAKAYSNGEISKSKSDQLCKLINATVRIYEVTVIKEEIKLIKDHLDLA